MSFFNTAYIYQFRMQNVTWQTASVDVHVTCELLTWQTASVDVHVTLFTLTGEVELTL